MLACLAELQESNSFMIASCEELRNNHLRNWDINRILYWLKEELGLARIQDELWRQHVSNGRAIVYLDEQILNDCLQIKQPKQRQNILQSIA